jgi:hypothetical protein
MTTDHVITTNFDDVFGASYRRLAELKKDLPRHPRTSSLPDFDVSDRFRRHRIVYLHGRADEEYIIFKRDDYEHYYPSVANNPDGDRCLETYLEHVYNGRTIVFVGFSFDDVYMRQCLRDIHRRLVARDRRSAYKIGRTEVVPRIRHYAFMPEVGPTAKEQKIGMEVEGQLESMNIGVIRLRLYRDWMDCFERVRETRSRGQKMLSKPGKRGTSHAARFL